MKASKLVYNNNNFTSVSGVAQTGIYVTRNNKKASYYFGNEEWLNNQTLKKMKIGYIDSYRRTTRLGIEPKIALFMYNRYDSQIYHIGNLYKVKQIIPEEIEEIRQELLQNNWLNYAQEGFNNIGDNRQINQHTQYFNCWNSNNITGDIGKSFIINIRYSRIEIFKEKLQVNNLSLSLPLINKKWKRLVDLYNVPEEWERHLL
jgi:hypothetical protein